MTVNETYTKMMEAFVRAPIAQYSASIDWVEDKGIDSIEQARTQEEREQVVAIANILCFFAYCLYKIENIQKEDPEKVDGIIGHAFRLLYLQGIIKVYFCTEKDTVGKDAQKSAREAADIYEVRLFDEASWNGARTILRGNLVLLQDYSGKILFVQEHIPKHA